MKAIKIPRIKKGAKGISIPLYIEPNLSGEILFSKNNNTTYKAPNQKPKIIAETPEMKPSIAPIPKESLTSPKPIH